LPTTPEFVRALVQAADDPHVRVREAAILNLTDHAVESGRSVLLRRLHDDPWPFIRAASIKGLLSLPPSPAVESALAERAEQDPSANVRRPALYALGAIGARAQVQLVRDRLDDGDEDPYVRAAAASTLGALCDRTSVDVLTGYARAIARLSDDEASQVIGRAAVSALGRLAPADLQKRFEMFDGDEVPPWSKQVADAALSYPEPCSAR
jgi:HEAT repeat protein